MRDDDEEDLKLRDWAVPPPPADLVGRVLSQLEAGEDTSVAPKFVPVDPPPAARRAVSAGALVAAALVGAAAAAAAVIAVYESGDDGAPEVTRDEPAPPVPAPVPPTESLDGEKITHTVPKHTPPTETRRFASESERRKAWERLVAARALREAGVTGGGGGAAGGGGATAEVTREDIQTSVREVVPLLAECFEMAGEVVKREGGTLVAELIVGSEPDVGTIVEEASFLQDRSTPHMLGDPDFTECVHETLMSVEMPPLAAGGQLVIHYPFVFSSDEPEMTGPTTAEELADDAAAAARSGQYGKALRLAEEALTLQPGLQSALTSAAIAACNLKQAAKAKLYISQLSGQRQGMVRQVCLRNNVNVD